MGESRHDTREQLLFKGLLLRTLIEEMGFRVLILEESYYHAESLDRFVTSGEGDPRELMNDLAAWYLWDTEEMLDLVLWVRRFNENREAKDQVRIFGADITAPIDGTREVLDALERAEIDTRNLAANLALDLQEGDFWPATWTRYGELPEENRLATRIAYRNLEDILEREKTKLIMQSSAKEYDRLSWLARIGGWANEFFLCTDINSGGIVREKGMSETTLWILEHRAPMERGVLWAHNLHVSASPFRMPDVVEGIHEPMGLLLRDKLGEDYLVIGGVFGFGTYGPEFPPGERRLDVLPQETVDGACAAIGSDCFFLDLRESRSEEEARAWLFTERVMRAQDFNSHLNPGKAFDLIYYVNEISRAQVTPLALSKYGNMPD